MEMIMRLILGCAVGLARMTVSDWKFFENCGKFEFIILRLVRLGFLE